jgi:alkylhydroperoxidase family enzyme
VAALAHTSAEADLGALEAAADRAVSSLACSFCGRSHSPFVRRRAPRPRPPWARSRR